MNQSMQTLVSIEVLEGVQQNFIHQHGVGLCFFDENLKALTRHNLNLPALNHIEPRQQKLFRVFFNLEKMDISFSASNPRPIHRTFCKGLILRSVVPLVFKRKILGYGCLLTFSREIDALKDQSLLSNLEMIEDMPGRINEMMDVQPVEQSEKLYITLNLLANTLNLFFEAGHARTNLLEEKISSATNERDEVFDSENNEKEESNETPTHPTTTSGVFFCSIAGYIFDAMPNSADLLGYEDPSELCDLSLTDDLLVNEADKDHLRNLLISHNHDKMNALLMRKNRSVLLAELELRPQKDEQITLGYECHITLLTPVPESGFIEAVEDQSAIGLITDYMQQKDDAPSVADDLLNWGDETTQPRQSPELNAEEWIPSNEQGSEHLPLKSFTQFLDIVPVPLFVLDKGDSIKVWNKAIEKLLNIPAMSVIDSNMLNLIVSNSHPMWMRWKEELRSLTEQTSFEPKALLPLIKKDASILLARIQLHQLKLQERDYISVIIEHIENEESLNPIQIETRRPQYEKDAHDNDLQMLRLHYKHVRHQFSDISEKLGDNISKIYVESLRNEDLKKKYGALRRVADQCAQIDRQLSFFTGEIKPTLKPADINHIISEIGLRLQQFLPINIELQTLFDRQLPQVMVDSDMIVHALGALCRNALEAMPNGGTLTLATSRETTGVQIKITDTGIGFAQHLTRKIFHPFFTTKGNHFGKGLGLSAAWGIASLHHAEIIINSRLNHGTTVVLQLLNLNPQTQKSFIAKENGSATILVVDDAEDIAEATMMTLNRAGYNTLMCTDCDQAQKLLTRQQKIDLIIMDYHLGKMSGLTCARQILQNRPHIGILFYSGADENPELVAFMAHHNAGLIRKPCKSQDLINEIERILKRLHSH